MTPSVSSFTLSLISLLSWNICSLVSQILVAEVGGFVEMALAFIFMVIDVSIHVSVPLRSLRH